VDPKKSWTPPASPKDCTLLLVLRVACNIPYSVDCTITRKNDGTAGLYALYGLPQMS